MSALARIAVVVAGVVLVAACGGATTPASQVPALATALDEVDAALVAGDEDTARTALDRLTSLATDARDEGRLEDGDAEHVLAAAEQLRARLDDAAEDDDVVEETDEPDPEPPPATVHTRKTKKTGGTAKTRGSRHGTGHGTSHGSGHGTRGTRG